MNKKIINGIICFIIFCIANTTAFAEMQTQSLSMGTDPTDESKKITSQTFTYTEIQPHKISVSEDVIEQEAVPQNVIINNYYPANNYVTTRYIPVVPYYSRTYPTYSGHINNGYVNAGFSNSGYTFRGGYDFGNSAAARQTYNYPPPPMPNHHNGMMPQPHHNHMPPPSRPGSAGFNVHW